MGLAASQARFLGLTARKSNVEYKGQQINQARTALSNEVNGLYNKYNKLEVPVPPSKQDYVKTKYILNETAEDFEIGSFSKILSGEYEGYYNVVLEYNDSVPKIYTHNVKNSVLTMERDRVNGSYSYLNFKLGTESYTYDANDENGSNVKKIVVTDEEGDTTPQKYQGLEALMEKYHLTSGTFYMFMKDGKPYYTSDYDLDQIEFTETDGKNMYYGSYSFDYQGEMAKTSTAKAIAALTQNSSGRLTAIQILASDDDDIQGMIGSTYSIKTSAEDDEAGYADAMNQYNYEKAKYERQVELINKKTELLQKEDRSLELELNQLDTEQKALATEMESVTKVIKDTIDSVFKTYDS